MANRIAGRPWTLDTATPGIPVWTSWIKIAHFEFSGYAAAGDKAILTDKNGEPVWQANGIATLEDQDSFKISWVQGLIPQQIDSGTVYVYIE
jgi:hypothetical protein